MANSDSGKIASIANPVPLDMINSWLRGEYLISQNESTGYEFLGWALMLRGAYVYVVVKESKSGGTNGKEKITITGFSHWGICTIDINDGDLTYQGVRLASLCQNKEVKDGKKIWYSIFSKLIRVPTSKDNTPDAYFGYFMHDIKQNGREAKYEINKLFNNSPPEKNKRDSLKSGSPQHISSSLRNISGSPQYIYSSLRKKFLGSLNNLCDSLYKYLCDGSFEKDRQLATNENPSDDEISAIAQIDLKFWEPDKFKLLKGKFQPALKKTGNDMVYLQGASSIYFFPLIPKSPAKSEMNAKVGKTKVNS